MRIRTLCLFLLLALVVAVAAPAQQDQAAEQAADKAAEQAADKAQAVAAAAVKQLQANTAADPKIDIAELERLLLPLFPEQVEKQVENWILALQSVIQKISAAETAEDKLKATLEATEPNKGETPEAFAERKKAAEGSRDAILEDLTELRELRTMVIDRVRVVLAAFKEKGGDIAKQELYVASVTGNPLDGVDATDVGATYSVIQAWVLSEQGGIRWAKNIGLFILTLIAFMILGRILGRILSRGLAKFQGTSDLLRNFFVNSVRKVTVFIGVVIGLSFLEIDVTPFLAAIGAAGFVIGFALQGTLSNFASGVMILLYRPYDIGDAVSVSGVSGTVNAMTLVSTTILTWDNQKVVVPNNKIWGDVITNITGSSTRRVDMVFGIGYSDDIDKAKKVLTEIVEKNDKVLSTPEPNIQLHELADSSVNFVVRPWTKTADYWDVYWQVTQEVKKRFDAESISIPFPQRDVHVFQEDPVAETSPQSKPAQGKPAQNKPAKGKAMADDPAQNDTHEDDASN